ncbi:MAG: NAD(P)H-dependent oxidoreductase [Candidatus Hermodarchaeota archaeon]
MKIVILNGSPKGDLSVTMQYVHYIKKKFPQHEYKIINVAQRIKALEKDEKLFQKIMDDVNNSDGIIWGFPLYYMLVCSQYKRFIELLFEKKTETNFHYKYAAIIATSIHFFDHTAVNYIHSICDDLNMKYVGFYSAHMDDLLDKERRAQLELFAENYFYTMENNLPTSKQYPSIVNRNFEYRPSDLKYEKLKINNKKLLIITDSTDPNENQGKMINRFKEYFTETPELIDINDLNILGGCLGCCRCAYENKCVYQDKDEFIGFWKNKMMAADILVFVGTIKDRYISSRWKMIFDRSFFNGHVPTLIGKQIGLIISGPIAQIPNLKQIFHSELSMQGSNVVDIVTDEFGDSKEIDALLYNLAEKLIRLSKSEFSRPPIFLEIGGQKLFRDDIYKTMRAVFHADHKFYKKHGFYDFPKKTFGSRILRALFKMKGFRKAMEKDNRMSKEMIKPLQKVVEKA